MRCEYSSSLLHLLVSVELEAEVDQLNLERLQLSARLDSVGRGHFLPFISSSHVSFLLSPPVLPPGQVSHLCQSPDAAPPAHLPLIAPLATKQTTKASFVKNMGFDSYL